MRLAGLAAWTLFAVTCNKGYMAIWFTPEAAVFNDISTHFSGMASGTSSLAITNAFWCALPLPCSGCSDSNGPSAG